jgi:hypothetical protein
MSRAASWNLASVTSLARPVFINAIRPALYAPGWVRGWPIDTAGYCALRAILTHSPNFTVGEHFNWGLEEASTEQGQFEALPPTNFLAQDLGGLSAVWLPLGPWAGRKRWLRPVVHYGPAPLILGILIELSRDQDAPFGPEFSRGIRARTDE